MPGGDGRGPAGRGFGRGGGFGGGYGRGSAGRGYGGPNVCYCPSCKHEVPHQRGVPCNTIKCPKCGATMAPKY